MVTNNVFHDLRKLYGRTANGQSNRQDIKITMTPDTLDLLKEHVEFGRGKNGSALIELSVRLMLSLVGEGNDLDMIAEELESSVDSPYMSRNLQTLSRYLDA